MGQLSYPAMLAEFYEQSDASDVFEFRTSEDRMRHIQYQFAERNKPQVVFKTVRKGQSDAPAATLAAKQARAHAFKPLI